MSAVMTIDHMSQLVDALDRQDFPALLLERLETLVPFDLYAVFFYDGNPRRPVCIATSVRRAGTLAASLLGRHVPLSPVFPASPAGHRKRRPFPAELCRSPFLHRPERDCDSIRLSRDRRSAI